MAAIETMLQKGHCPYQKVPPLKNGTQHKIYLTKMASRKNSISQKWHLKTYIIGFLKCYQHQLIEPTPTIKKTGKARF